MNDQKPKTTDEKAIKENRRTVKSAQDDELNDLRVLLNNPNGVRFLARLLKDCRLYETSADNSGSWTYFNEGVRNVGLKLLDKLEKADPDAMLKLVQAKGDLYVNATHG